MNICNNVLCNKCNNVYIIYIYIYIYNNVIMYI